ncbi:MAG: protein translocase subunit SecD [Alphaproteobacteria bacterium]|jgi:protein-export membrane protein SecD|nr:MAG: protein translocase subunit SecD [Alphaproteobacteria bacterium]
MLHFVRWKQIAIVLSVVLGIVLVIPSFFAKETVANWPWFFPRAQINLGLDLRGGAHLLLSMETAEVRKDWLETLRDDARKRLRDAKIAVTGVGISNNAVQVRLAKAEDGDAALKELRPLSQQTGDLIRGFAGRDLEMRKEGSVIVIAPTEAGLQQRITDAISAAIETVRRRVDFTGTTEAQIVRQGSDRILVQVPGLLDTAPLKELIGKTARLTFHEVHPTISAEEAKKTRPPTGYRVWPGSDREEGDQLLRETPVVRGDELKSAQPAFDQQTHEPIIAFTFNGSGARKFGEFTKTHVGRPFAIVLDDKVISAPVIRDAILGGSGQISGSFTVETANQLAIQLRSGALPAKLTVIEERVVGASLGQDSIDAGKLAALVGGFAVAFFMIFAYGLLGVFAVIGAAIHVMFVLAIMAVIGSTMTLPGIAGIVLTIGMAVDANVLINERIREELRGGRTPISAIETGFTRAYGTIIDSQLTTFIAGLVMFWLGSGPIRGFAVTLTLGIMTTVYTAFTIARLLVVWWLATQKTRKVEAPLTYKPPASWKTDSART